MTGATGFVGYAVAAALRDPGHAQIVGDAYAACPGP